MKKNILILFWVFILAVVILSTPTKCSNKINGNNDENDNIENFYTHYGYYKKYCPSCGWRSRYSCAKCTNCGYCINKSGYGECVPGDSSGPYFRRDCVYWEYGDPYYYYPYSHIYPVVKTSSAYPYYRWRHRRPWRNSKHYNKKYGRRDNRNKK